MTENDWPLRLENPVEAKSKTRGIGIGEDESVGGRNEAANRNPVAWSEQGGSLNDVAPVGGGLDGESELAICQLDRIGQRCRGHHVHRTDHSEGGVA